ncbi:MAG: B12-binding domain-containing radical SAM protein [Deltaproteobacteria bacterium]|nr:B12-binding domain-containing radical SAM protein [Deltaproteobacteria bacterium]MCL5277730.1 B12-binding domain-containing radical SAM protein [Deltaproteobacteria bacterium]
MKILFIIPPFSSGGGWLVPHIGIAYMAAVLKQKGYDVTIADAIAERLSGPGIVDSIKKVKPDIVGLTATTQQIYTASIIANEVKGISPEIKTIIGGCHVSPLPEQTLREFSSFDYAVIGEGELVLPELLRAISDGNDGALVNIKGIAYRTDDKVVVNPQGSYVDVNSLPMPDFDGFDLSLYRPFYTLPIHGYRELPILTSRGCPYDCVFCFRTKGKIARYRTVQSVINEVKRDIETYHANQISFIDDTFTTNMKRTEMICDELMKAGIHKKIEWSCGTRADVVSGPLLSKMKQAGCRVISYGIESGDQKILDKATKGLKIEEIREAIRLTKHAGIDVYANFIIGLPYDTVDSINKTIDFAMGLDIDAASFAILTPFPGTGLIDMIKNGSGGLKMISSDWRDYHKHLGRSLELDAVDRKKLEKLQRKAYMKFYLRPKRFINMFKIVGLGTIMSYALQRVYIKKSGPSRINDHSV